MSAMLRLKFLFVFVLNARYDNTTLLKIMLKPRKLTERIQVYTQDNNIILIDDREYRMSYSTSPW